MKKAEVISWLRNPKRKGAEVQKIVDALNLIVEPGGSFSTRKSRAVEALEALPGDQVILPDEVIARIAVDVISAEPAVPLSVESEVVGLVEERVTLSPARRLILRIGDIEVTGSPSSLKSESRSGLSLIERLRRGYNAAFPKSEK